MFANDKENVFISFTKIDNDIEFFSPRDGFISLYDENSADKVIFDSFLEDFSEQITLSDTQLNAVPIRTTADTILNRLSVSIKLSFSCYSRNRKESIDNYKKLYKLKSFLKPTYAQKNGQFVIKNRNLFGLVYLDFGGLIFSKDKGVRILPSNFSFEINKETGYIFAPKTKGSDDDFKSESFETTANEELAAVPISFKINIDAKALLTLEQTSTIKTPLEVYKKPREILPPDEAAAFTDMVENQLTERDSRAFGDSAIPDDINPFAIVYFENLLIRLGVTNSKLTGLQTTLKYFQALREYQRGPFEVIVMAYKSDGSARAGVRITDKETKAVAAATQLANSLR